jgi:hypothetical protein
MKKIRSLLFIFLLVITLPALAQDEEGNTKPTVNRWNFGINFGVYDAHKYPASYYNGFYTNENNISYVMSNYYWYQDIKQALGASDTVIVADFPFDIHYNVVMSGGVFLRYNFDKNWGLCVDVNYTQMKTEDALAFEVDPMSFPTLPDYRMIPITGKERRVHMDLLLQRNFWTKSSIYLFIQGGAYMNYTRVQALSIFVDREYSLINVYGNQVYVPNTNMQEDQVILGGVGYGALLGGGMGIPLVDFLGVEPGGYLTYSNVALNGYPDFKISYGFYLRFLFGNIMHGPEEQ